MADRVLLDEQVAPLPHGVEIWYETIGQPHARPLLRVRGLSGPMTWWPLELCRQLADDGFLVIRYDNRATGRSSRISDKRVTRADLVKGFLGRRIEVHYSLKD